MYYIFLLLKIKWHSLDKEFDMIPVQNEKNKKRRWFGTSLDMRQNKKVNGPPTRMFEKVKTLDKGVYGSDPETERDLLDTHRETLGKARMFLNWRNTLLPRNNVFQTKNNLLTKENK